MRINEGLQLSLYGDILTYASAKIADYGLGACGTRNPTGKCRTDST